MADWTKQLYFEDAAEGTEIPPVTFHLTVQRMIIAATAARGFSPVHHNTRVAQEGGASDMYASNLFLQGMWTRAVQEFIGLDGRIKKVGPFRMRIFNTPGDTVVTQGKVRKKWQEGGENVVELEVWSKNSKGVSVGPGPVLVTLPSRPR